MDPELWEMIEEGDSEDEVAAIIRLGQPGIAPPGARVIAQLGEIVTVRMQRGSIINIREDVEVMSFKAPGPPMGPDVELDDIELLEDLPESPQPSDEHRPPGLDATGRGVVVGIVDWGFDFAHPDFRNPDGSTRILALWDQRGRPRPKSPQPYGYGVVHTREAIKQALAANDPYAALGYHPADADMGRGSHGTLVASIAAGSGTGGGPLGIAPESDLVFVHLANWGQDRSAKLGNSVTLLEAIDFIARKAGERPWAINISMGRTGEQHDGTTLSEQGLDAVLRAAPGRVICQSTGNYFTRRLHASGQLRPAEERTLSWEIKKADVTPNELEIWYPGRDKMEVEIRSPNSQVLAHLKLGERVPLIANGETVGRAYHRASEPNTLDNHIDIFLYTGAPAGVWEVTLIAADVVDGRFHAWIERDAACPNCQSDFRQGDADPTSTTGTICNGLRTIAVGAYNPHHPDQPVASFSSMGPTRDGRLKPDLCAPGLGILGARSAPRDANGQAPLLTRMSGTSFAAPHVTGCVALMLQVAPRPLRIEEVHNVLLASTRKVYAPDELPGRVGSGYLDIARAVEAARNIGRIGPELKSVSLAKEGAMMREDQEIEVAEFVEGKAEEEADAEEASSWQNTFHRIASDITGAFEGGKPSTLNLYDRGIISYGKHQATLASGTLYPILKRYTELSSSATATNITAYLERVNQRDESLREDKDFIQLLKDAAKEPEMNRAQDEEFTRQYWEPSKRAARAAGITSALGFVILYDTRVQGGMQQVLKSTQERLGGKVGDTVGSQEITEQEFLRVFVDERIKRNFRISANQKKQAEAIYKQADALEQQAAAADTNRAAELRRQAADKRKQAKQYAANSAALEISANKTRGPSLTALVDSGNLSLYGDADGKIYLKGKSGVAISGLKPGATIDSTTLAEQGEEEADEEAATKRNFVLISGGPGPFDNRDVEHDQSWANYVTPPLLLTDTAAERKAFAEEDEEVWWFVYKPAYERRWAEDSSSSNAARKKAVKDVKDQGFSSYTDLIEARASKRGWYLRWLADADELWKKLETFSKNSISRVWYWGHARDDLWLAVQHDADTGVAIAPNAGAIIKVSSIDSKLKNRFRKGDVGRMNRFIGCNTVEFAVAWAKSFGVWAEGVEGKVNFASIHKTGGEPCLVDSAQVKFYSPGGKAEPGETWRSKAVKCSTLPSENLEAVWDEDQSPGEVDEAFVPDTPENMAWAEADELIDVVAEYEPELCNQREQEPTCRCRTRLVELVDEAIASGALGRRSSVLLEYAFNAAGVSESLNGMSSGDFSPAAIFDVFAYPKRMDRRSQLEQMFETITMPRSVLTKELQPGDLLLRRGEGAFGHAALIASPELITHEQLSMAARRAESLQPGQYVRVVEGGISPHGLDDNFARRLTDADGRVPHDTLVLRLREVNPATTGWYVDSAETVEGPCADVVLPHRLLIRGSVHPSVREAQRKLNHFHHLEIAAGRAGLPNAPLKEDCVFGEKTHKAVLEFQRRVFSGRPMEHDGKIGDHTWTELDRFAALSVPSPAVPTPPPSPLPPAPSTPPGPPASARVCCILAPSVMPFGTDDNLADLSNLGTHRASNEVSGLVYTGRAGFVDLGHLRDLCDLTKNVFDQIAFARAATGTVIRTTHGEAILSALPAGVSIIGVARSISYDDSFGYEILTYSHNSPGAHNSAFSPEDLSSNFLGTLVAERAIARGGNFDAAVTTELSALLAALDSQIKTASLDAFNLINGRWVSYSGLTSLGSSGYLKRRNFTRDPWKAGHGSDSPTPAFVTAGFGFSGIPPYDYTHTFGRTIPKSTFAAEVAAIRADAASKYGSNFDRP